MDANELHKWLIESFGQEGGQRAWEQFSSLPDSIKDGLLSKSSAPLPDPKEVKSFLAAFAASANTAGKGASPINQPLARELAKQTAEKKSANRISALQADKLEQAMRGADLWLDSATALPPLSEKLAIMTPEQWAEGSIKAWIGLASPVALHTNKAMADILKDRLDEGGIANVFAGPVPIPISPNDLSDPAKLVFSLAKTTFAMQLGKEVGEMSGSLFGSFDYGVRTIGGQSGALIPENLDSFASELEIPQEEAYAFHALREAACARLYASTPWLDTQIKALIKKYSREIRVDREAMEEEMENSDFINPEGVAGVMSLKNVKFANSKEQLEAKREMERLLNLIEGWVECVTWRAGSAFIPHISQLREMMRRRKAGKEGSDWALSDLLGLDLKPGDVWKAWEKWNALSADIKGRDALWSHPRLLSKVDGQGEADGGEDWDSALSGLLEES